MVGESPPDGEPEDADGRRNADLSVVQHEILQLVDSRPGATIMGVADLLGLAHSTATYHLNRLVQRGFLQRHREGRNLRHFAARTDRSVAATRLAAIMRDEQRARVVDFMGREAVGHFSINQIARILGEPFSRVKSVVTNLARAGFVELDCHNGRYRIRKRQHLASTLDHLRMSEVATQLEADLPPQDGFEVDHEPLPAR